MKYIILTLCLFTSPAFASDSYQSGYDAGYYTGALSEHGDDYGRGVDDGSYDAYQEDMARSSYTVGDAVQKDEQAKDNSIDYENH